MTVSQAFTLAASDDATLHGLCWLPAGTPRAVVVISHGMSEHAGRYHALAAHLVAAGYAVYAHDHRGHEKAREAEALGGLDGALVHRQDAGAEHLAHIGGIGDAEADDPGLEGGQVDAEIWVARILLKRGGPQ